MMEKPTAPKSSETDPPAANQALDDAEAARPSEADSPPADQARVEPAPEIVPGKPDGEVDTRT